MDPTDPTPSSRDGPGIAHRPGARLREVQNDEPTTVPSRRIGTRMARAGSDGGGQAGRDPDGGVRTAVRGGMVVGILGGVLGILGALIAMALGLGADASGAEASLHTFAGIGVACGAVGVVGAYLSARHAVFGGALMLAAAIVGFFMVPVVFLVGAVLLAIGGLVALVQNDASEAHAGGVGVRGH